MSKERETAARKKRGDKAPITGAAMVVGIEEEPGRVRVRHAAGFAVARLAVASPYAPSEGDRVVVVGDGEELWVVGVVVAARPPGLALEGGGSVVVAGGAAEIRDAAGKLVVRYANGTAEIAAPGGDLLLSAPTGRVVVQSGSDVEIEAARDIRQRAARRVSAEAGTAALTVGARAIEAKAPAIRATAKRTELETVRGTVTAQQLETRAEKHAVRAEELEITASRIVEKARDVFRDAADLAQTRVGRARTVVREAWSLCTRRTVMESKEDTSIDGKKVLLG